MPSRFLPVGKDAQGAARFLLAALPALGALLTALAITGNLVGRMARNHPWASFASFGCATSPAPSAASGSAVAVETASASSDAGATSLSMACLGSANRNSSPRPAYRPWRWKLA